MKITYKQDYISIRQFEPIEIKKFSILTGLNGAGKSHFLQAINNGQIQIDNINKDEIVYYNYSSFTVDDSQKNTQQNKTRTISSPKSWENIRNQILQKLNKVKQVINRTSFNDKDFIDRIILQIIQRENYNFDAFFSSENGLKKFESLQDIREQMNIVMSNPERYHPLLSEFLMNTVDNPEINNLDFNIENLKEKFIEIEENFKSEYNSKFEEELKRQDIELYDYLKNQELDKDLFHISSKDFESTDIVLEEIANKEKDYQFLKLQNALNKTLSIENNGSFSYLENEDFIKTYGESPVTLINEVLNEYDCNGYYLTSNNLNISLGIAKDQMRVVLRLFNKNKNYQTNFSQLSSGEKTIITLSLLIVKIKNKVLPKVLLLDEIDSALHPSMIKRLINVIKNIFVGQKKLKVILATHSATTIALSEKDNIYLVDNSSNEILKPQNQEKAIEILSEGFITLNEGLSIFNQFNEKKITILTEGNNISFLKKAIEILKPELKNSVDIIENIKDRTGKNQLKVMFDFFKKTNHKCKILFIYDCDVKTISKDENNTFSFTFNKNEKNKKVLKGIENLFDDNLFAEHFYTIQTKDDGGSVTNLNKSKFENYILENGTKEMFINFNELINKIEEIQ